jgi:hypothetical protein
MPPAARAVAGWAFVEPVRRSRDYEGEADGGSGAESFPRNPTNGPVRRILTWRGAMRTERHRCPVCASPLYFGGLPSFRIANSPLHAAGVSTIIRPLFCGNPSILCSVSWAVRLLRSVWRSSLWSWPPVALRRRGRPARGRPAGRRTLRPPRRRAEPRWSTPPERKGRGALGQLSRTPRRCSRSWRSCRT